MGFIWFYISQEETKEAAQPSFLPKAAKLRAALIQEDTPTLSENLEASQFEDPVFTCDNTDTNLAPSLVEAVKVPDVKKVISNKPDKLSLKKL